MRRSQRKRQKYFLGFIPQKAMPLVLAGIGLLAVGGAVAVWLGNRPDPNYRPAVTGAPAIEVDETAFDIGEQKFNVPAEVTYVVRNVGDQTLRILETPPVEVLEGC
jgi:hypothetical protein